MRIVLAHGVLGFGVLGPLEYFNGVKRHLRRTFGAEVLVASVPPIGSVSERGERLAQRIVNEWPAGEKVHILAHSMGGLDARWAIRNATDFAARVKTLVTIGTPHLGSPVADAIASGNPAALDDIPLPLRVELQVNQRALHDLRTSVATQFDAATPDVPGVRYLEIAGDVSLPGAHCALLFRSIQTIFKLHPRNDGVVTLHSATRGGTRKPFAIWPTDHAGEIGWNLDLPIPVGLPFDDTSHLPRYEAIVRAL